MAMGQADSEWWETGEEAGSMVGGLVGEGWESRGEASGTVESAGCVLRWYVNKDGETTSIEFGREDRTSLTFWSELPRGQGIGSTS